MFEKTTSYPFILTLDVPERRQAEMMKKLSLILVFSLLLAAGGCGKSGQFDETMKKAQQGDAEAQNKLGALYYKGEGVTQDYKQAAYWAQKAAEQGRTDAQVNLAIMYYKGEGVTQDFKQAYVWWSLASARGDISIDGDIKNVAGKLSPGQLAEAQELIAKIQGK
jgi:hypothetical protein